MSAVNDEWQEHVVASIVAISVDAPRESAKRTFIIHWKLRRGPQIKEPRQITWNTRQDPFRQCELRNLRPSRNRKHSDGLFQICQICRQTWPERRHARAPVVRPSHSLSSYHLVLAFSTRPDNQKVQALANPPRSTSCDVLSASGAGVTRAQQCAIRREENLFSQVVSPAIGSEQAGKVYHLLPAPHRTTCLFGYLHT